MELLLNVHLVRLWVPDGFFEQIHWSMREMTSYSSNIQYAHFTFIAHRSSKTCRTNACVAVIVQETWSTGCIFYTRRWVARILWWREHLQYKTGIKLILEWLMLESTAFYISMGLFSLTGGHNQKFSATLLQWPRKKNLGSRLWCRMQ